ncbi:hypothetical protein Tco_1013529 [Tanacetum coccineum]
MDNTRAQQKALDDELEPTHQVALDAFKLTPFYNAFKISADVPEIYMQEFWVTVYRHHSSLRFKLNGKIHTVNVDNFKDMLKICPKLPVEEEVYDEVNVSKDNDDDADNDDDVDKDGEDDNADNQDDEIPDDANQDDDDEQTNSDNDGDDFVHPKLSTHDDEARQDDEVNEDESDEESDD